MMWAGVEAEESGAGVEERSGGVEVEGCDDEGEGSAQLARQAHCPHCPACEDQTGCPAKF